MATAVNNEEFETTLDTIVKDIIGDGNYNKEIAVSIKRHEEHLRYTINKDHNIWVYPVMQAFRDLNVDPLSQEDVKLASVLGWCYNMILVYLISGDDIMDQDEFRYGKPVWYLLHEKRSIAVNDTFLLEQAPYRLLRKYFGKLPVYTELLHYFQDMVRSYFLGNSLDLQTTKDECPDMSSFTWEKYRAFINSSAGQMFAGVFEICLIWARYPKESCTRTKMRAICNDIGTFWRTKDDLNDSFGEDMSSPLRDQDIKNGLCRWPILKAKECASPEQWKILIVNYGIDDPEKVELVKNVLVELGVPEMGRMELEALKKKLDADIDELIQNGHKIGNSIKSLLETQTASKDY